MAAEHVFSRQCWWKPFTVCSSERCPWVLLLAQCPVKGTESAATCSRHSVTAHCLCRLMSSCSFLYRSLLGWIGGLCLRLELGGVSKAIRGIQLFCRGECSWHSPHLGKWTCPRVQEILSERGQERYNESVFKYTLNSLVQFREMSKSGTVLIRTNELKGEWKTKMSSYY